MIRAALCALAFLPSIALAQQNAANSTPGTPASQATQIQGCITCTTVGVGIDYSGDFGSIAPSGQALSGLPADPGTQFSGGVPYSPTGPSPGCAVLKTSLGNLFGYSFGAIGFATGHTYWLLIMDASAAPSTNTAIANGTQTGGAPGLIVPPILLPTTGAAITSPPMAFPINYLNGLVFCISESAAPQTFVVPTDQVPAIDVSLFGFHL